MSERKNVFVIGLDDAHRADIRAIPDAERFELHELLHTREVIALDQYPVGKLLEKARQKLRDFPGTVDGIIGHWDFPVSVFLPILCEEQGLRGPSLRSVLACEHKYWSRLEQREVVPECTPDFCAVDPFAEDPMAQLTLDYPFWIKPVKAYGSALGFRVDEKRDFDRAIDAAREEIRRFGDPFNLFLELVEQPAELEGVDGNSMIVEQLVGGWELAPEGYVQDGRFHAHGMIDMVRGENGKSFLRYEYPSQAPPGVQERAIEAARRVLAHVGYDNGCFNIEFFYDQHEDRIWIIEINPRISQSHSRLFALVDGMSNHEVAIHVALGDAVRFEHGKGPFSHAAKFLHRRFDTRDAVATRVPTRDDVARLREVQPETIYHSALTPGMRLSELMDQDPYSYILAQLDIGAHAADELDVRYREAVNLLPFEFEPCDT